MDNLRELRLALVEAEKLLTENQDYLTDVLGNLLKDVKIKATTKETREIEIAGIFGDDPRYRRALSAVRSAKYSRDRAEAILESAKDARRKWEWDIRSKLADAIERSGVQSDHQDYADDGAWDDATDRQIEDDLYVKTQDAQAHSLRTSGDQDWWDNLPKAQSDDLDF